MTSKHQTSQAHQRPDQTDTHAGSAAADGADDVRADMWGKSLTDDEFTRALTRVLQTQRHAPPQRRGE